jgi:hypothetical protein
MNLARLPSKTVLDLFQSQFDIAAKDSQFANALFCPAAPNLVKTIGGNFNLISNR